MRLVALALVAGCSGGASTKRAEPSPAQTELSNVETPAAKLPNTFTYVAK